MAERSGVVLDEVVDQDRQIGDALTQRGRLMVTALIPEEEIEAEGTVLDLGPRISSLAAETRRVAIERDSCPPTRTKVPSCNT